MSYDHVTALQPEEESKTVSKKSLASKMLSLTSLAHTDLDLLINSSGFFEHN